MELRRIEYFCKTCEYLKISAAARELFISEQALSRQILQFERECGFILFTRSPKGLKLTQAGQMVYERASGLLNSLGDFQAFLRETEEGQSKPTIRFGVYSGFLIGVDKPSLVERLLKFSDECPECMLSVYEEPNEVIHRRVLDRSLDLGVFVGEIPSGCMGTTVSNVSLCAAVSIENPLSRKSHLLWSDLDGQRLIHLPGKWSMRSDIEKICEHHGAKPLNGNAVVAAMTALQYVYANAGIAFLDERYRAVIDCDKAQLVPLPKDVGFTHPSISVIWRQDFEPALIHKKLVGSLKEHFK